MATVDKDQIFTAEEIRDTAAHNSSVANTGEFNAETIVVYNGLNETVTIQLEGSLDGNIWLKIGSPFTVETSEYDTVTDYFPSYRVVAQCSSTAPTTGDLDVWILKAGATS